MSRKASPNPASTPTDLSLQESLRLYPIVWLRYEPVLGMSLAKEALKTIQGIETVKAAVWNMANGLCKNPENDLYWVSTAKSSVQAEQDLLTGLLTEKALIAHVDGVRLLANVQAAALRVIADDRRVVFVSTQEPPSDFLPDYLRMVEVSYTDLKQDVENLFQDHKADDRNFRDEVLPPLQGLNPFRSVQVVLESFMKTEPGDEESFLYAARQNAIAQDSGGIVTLQEPRIKFSDLIGLERAKRLLTSLTAQVAAGALVKGVLLSRIPGTGKTSLCEAVAGEAELPFYTLSLGAAFGSLVGESERRVRQALRTLSESPRGVVLIDEIEKSLSGSTQAAGRGDSGTAVRVGEQVLKYTTNPKANNGFHLILGTSNDLSALPPEFTRAGRWDALFWFGFPGNKALLDIKRLYAKQYELVTSFGKGADLSNYTPSEIESVCRIAKILDTDEWSEAAPYVPRLKVFRAEEIARMEADAKGRAVSADLDDDDILTSGKAGGRKAAVR